MDIIGTILIVDADASLKNALQAKYGILQSVNVMDVFLMTVQRANIGINQPVNANVSHKLALKDNIGMLMPANVNATIKIALQVKYLIQ
jgi:hypothetical protein